MKKVLNKINKKTLIIIGIIFVALLLILINSKAIINRIRENFEKEELVEFEYKTYEVSGNTGTTLVTIRNENKIQKISYKKYGTEEIFEIYVKGKRKVAFDYKMEDLKTYEIIATLENGEEKTYTINYEIPRMKGKYTLIGSTYVNEPDLTGLVKEKTRYLYLNATGNLVPGNWITDEAPNNWYNYAAQEWANIYVESDGIENYYVWIPRYVYKIDTENSVSGNERMDVKFINTYNEYIDVSTGEKLTWEELEAQGYKLPEAFTWSNSEGADLILPGYWLSKYQLSTLGTYKIDYNLVATKRTFNVSSFVNNVEEEAERYTYAINGQIVFTSKELYDYAFVNSIPEQTSTINITALDSAGEIIASMTKQIKLIEPNAPDLTGLDPDTTFYVYWDENGNEHNEIPISMNPPKDWYDYSYSQWANIVTRNNGLEIYYVWIPRYQYSLDQTSQRSNVRFIQGTGTDTYAGYSIPEAFTWVNQAGETVQLTGYWLTKYQLSAEESTPRLDAEMAVSGNTIKVKDITGTIVTDALANSTNLKIEYYLNGTKMHEGTNVTENYIYENLELAKTYTVNIILRNDSTNEYLGAITKKQTTEEANAPVLIGLNETMTYYVLYDENDNEIIGDLVKQDGSNMPTNWYNYRDSKWANIVVTDGTIVDGRITDATTTNYFTWIPRYEYRIIGDRSNLSTANRRTEVNFLSGTSDAKTEGYSVPEAFTWVNQAGETVQLPGYWLSKYQLSN